MSEDELAQLLKQRKERAAIIGRTRVRGEIECMNVLLCYLVGRELGCGCHVCRELSGVLCVIDLKFPTETVVVVHTIHCVVGIASSPGPSQILSRSRGEKSGEGLGSKLRHGPEMVDSVSTNRVHVTF